MKTLTLANEKKKKRLSFNRMNKTFAAEPRQMQKGFSLINLLNANASVRKNSITNDGNDKITPRELNISTQPETCVRRNLNDTFLLKSNRSSDNLSKKNVKGLF